VSGANHAVLIGSLVVSLITYASAYLVRGTLAGNGRFRNYGLMHGSEGAVRLLAVALIVVSGHATPGAFGLALVLPPIAAVLISLAGQHDLATPGPDASWSELSSALAWLLASSVMAQVLSYAPVFAAQIFVPGGSRSQQQLAGFVTAMFLARVPLLMFQAVQAALLPKLAGSAAAGRHDEFRAGLVRLLGLVLVIAGTGVVGALLFGEKVGTLVFKEKWTLNNRELALLAAGAGAYIVAFTLAQGLIALKAYSKLTLGWFVGMVGFVVVLPFGSDIFNRAQIAFLVSSGLAAVTIVTLLFSEMRTHSASIDDLLDAVVHEPLEF
jgi:O-antigen/teichoic acid export membrane protein